MARIPSCFHHHSECISWRKQFSRPPLPYRHLSDYHLCFVLSPTSCGAPFRPTFAENDILITIGIVNNSLLFEFQLKPPQYLCGQEMPNLDLFICCTSYHLHQTSASPHRAPEFRSVHCIGIKGYVHPFS